MGRNSQERKVIAEQTVRESVQKLGIKNPNWRNQFIRLYDELSQAKLQLHNTDCQIVNINYLVSIEKDERKKLEYADALVSLRLLQESQDNHLGLARENLVFLLNSPGKRWNLKEVLVELEEWKVLQKQMLE